MSLTSLFKTTPEPMPFSNYNRKQTGKYPAMAYKFVMQPRVARMRGRRAKKDSVIFCNKLKMNEFLAVSITEVK
jgi:hypothetical protein